MRTAIQILSILLALFMFDAGSAISSRAAAQSPDAGVTTSVVQLQTEDGLTIAAFLMHPESGLNPDAPGIVFHHGGFGGHGARRIGAPRSAAERMAAAGYTTITLISRHVDGYLYRDLEEARFDLAAAIDHLDRRGVSKIVLAGHSMGSVWTSIYQADRHDPRVKAMVHFAPTHDTQPLFKRKPFYAEMQHAAEQAIAAGRGSYGDTGLAQDEAPPLFETATGRPQTARALLSWWGDNPQNSNSLLFADLDVPILMLGGRLDPVVPDGRMEQLKALAANSPRVDFIWYETGDHYFTDLWDEAVFETISWLKELGLDAPTPIRTRFLDTTQTLVMDQGSPQERSYVMNYPGLLFVAPGDPKQTLVLLLPDRGGDIMDEDVMAKARAIAASGVSVLIPQLRTNNFRGMLNSSIETSVSDLRAWREVAENAGYETMEILALGMSGIWASAYTLEAPDALTRLSLWHPPASLADDLRDALGDRAYAEALATARKKLTADAPWQEPLQISLSADQEVPDIIQYPDSFLTYYSPGGVGDLSNWLNEIETETRLITDCQNENDLMRLAPIADDNSSVRIVCSTAGDFDWGDK